MTAATLTLTEFLEQRIADDEAEAQSAYDHDRWIVEQDGNGDTWVTQVDRANEHWRVAMFGNEFAANHIARHDPARVLAECAAKRAIVELHEPQDHPASPGYGSRRFCGVCGGDNACESPCPTLRALALPFADHDDYRPEWRP